jgi:hypothetical protein
MTRTIRFHQSPWLPAILFLAACGTDTGSLSVLLEAEDTIAEGLAPGTGPEDILDGWAVSFDAFIVAIGDVELEYTGEHMHAHAEDVYVVDLTQVPATGLPLWTIDGLDAGTWDFSFSTPTASAESMRHDTVTEADFTAMQASGVTYLIRGAISKSDGLSCPPTTLAMPPPGAVAMGMNSGGDACYANTDVAFALEVAADTVFGPCEIDGVPGVAIVGGQTVTVAATIHGDHLFFNGFPEGDEGGVMRLVQWLADSDLNVDGTVTEEELTMIAPSALPELDTRYQLGAPPIPLSTMWDYVVSQLKTQGHYQGEGECPFDGMAHMH